MNEDKNNCFKPDLANEVFLMDAKLYPLLNEAKNGCITAQGKLSDAFFLGQGADINYKLAEKYQRMIIEQCDNDFYELKLNMLVALGVGNRLRGNISKMEYWFREAMKYMTEEMPLEEWDFSIVEIMEDSISRI